MAVYGWLMDELPDLPASDLPPFNAITLSPTRANELKRQCDATQVYGVPLPVGSVDIRVDPWLPDDSALLVHGKEVVGIIRLGGENTGKVVVFK